MFEPVISNDKVSVVLQGYDAQGHLIMRSLPVPEDFNVLSIVEIRSANSVYARYPAIKRSPEPEPEPDEDDPLTPRLDRHERALNVIADVLSLDLKQVLEEE